MKIYDISQEVYGCAVFPGDPAPEKRVLARMEDGSLYNLTAFSMCAHNGTHVDAPAHFVKDGKTVSELSLDALVGYAYVAKWEGDVTAEDIRTILSRAEACNKEAARRILVKGRATLTPPAARVLAERGVLLFGNESQTVGPEDAPMETHLVLLGADVILLEGVRLGAVEEGVYLLSAAPLHLGSAEGAPCRALLLEL